MTRLTQTVQKWEKDFKNLCIPANLREGFDTFLQFFLRRKASGCLEGGGRVSPVSPPRR